MQAGEVRWDHLILEKYLFGRGNLYVITEVVKSNEIGVTAFKRRKLLKEIYQLETGFAGDVDVGVPARAPQDQPST